MALPVRGQHDWDDELNNAVNAIEATANAAAGNAEQARGNSIVALNEAAGAKQFVQAPTDARMAELTNTPGSAFGTALSASYGAIKAWAKDPDNLVTGTITLDANDLVTSAVVKWPDGLPGVLTITSRDTTGAVLDYNITRVSGGTTTTYTQPTITRNANGAATNVPEIVVS